MGFSQIVKAGYDYQARLCLFFRCIFPSMLSNHSRRMVLTGQSIVSVWLYCVSKICYDNNDALG